MTKKIWDKIMNREVISYLIFGVLTTLVNWAVYGIMLRAGIDYRVANAAAWAVSVLFAFLVNKLYVFQSRSWGLGFVTRELGAFVACRGVSGIMEMVFMILMVSWLRMDKYVSKVIVSVIVVIANYVFSKLFIFRKSDEKPL